MADRNQRLVSIVVTLLLLVLNLVALNYLVADSSLARLDLTEENRFSISSATRRILTSLDEDLTIYGYFSGRTHPKLSPLVPELVDLLEEYEAVSRGRVKVEIFDPSEDKAAEEEAADRFGVRSTPFRLASKYESGIVNAYFALVVRYGDQYKRYEFSDLIEVEPLPDGDIEVRLRNPEYDLTRAIKKVVYGFRNTNELFDRVSEPVRLTAIISNSTLPELFAEVPDALRKAADELKESGGDKFLFEEIDPTRDEQAAALVSQNFGLPPLSLGFFGGESFYLYGILEVGGQFEQLNLTAESITAASIREAVENSLQRHTPGFLKTVGVAAPDPPALPPQLQMQMQMQQPPPEFQEIKRYLGQNLQIKDVRLEDQGGVPSDVDVLLVVKPQSLGEDAVYNLDQYLMRGGRVILCVDNYDADFSESLSVTPLESGLEEWLTHHGVTLGNTLVLDDQNQPLPLPEMRHTPLGTLRTWVMAPYPYLVQVRDDGFKNPDITATLDSVGIYWGSPLTVNEESTAHLSVLPILESSEKSWTSDDVAQVGFVDYEVPVEGTAPQLLAVALSGKFKSFYTDRPVPGAEPPASPVEGKAAEAPAQPTTVAMKQSPETRLVIVGNSAFLSDFVATVLGRMDGSFFLENLRFMENVIDWISLDNDMLEIRARGMASRRLDRVEKGTEITMEAVNYALPTALILALGVYMYWKRKNAVSLLGSAGGLKP